MTQYILRTTPATKSAKNSLPEAYKKLKAGEITEQQYAEEYERCIPECCMYPTWELHANQLMLCWSLSNGGIAKDGSDCTDCTMNKYTGKGDV